MKFKIGILLVLATAFFLVAFRSYDQQQTVREEISHYPYVNAINIDKEEHYISKRSFVGQVEPERLSEVGFEFSGLVQKILVDEGETVHKGQVLAILDSQRLQARRDEIIAELRQAQARLELARLNLRRVQEMIRSQSTPEQKLDEAEQDYQVQKAIVLSAKTRIRSVAIDIQKSRLVAPYDSVVVKRYIDEGKIVTGNQPVLQVIERQQYRVRIGIAGKALAKIQEKQSYPLNIQGKTIDSQVQAILPNRELHARTVDVIFEIPYDVSIRSGDLAILQLELPIKEAGFWLPMSSLSEGFRGLWCCYVIQPDTDETYTVTPRQLEILYQDGDRVFVRGAIQHNDQVIVEGVHKIVPGQQVKLVQYITYQEKR